MKNQPKFAYFYDKLNKTESFGSVTRAHNYGKIQNDAEKAVRQVLPKKVEEYLMLKVTNQAPFCSFLSDVLSINFSEVVAQVGKYAISSKKKPGPGELELLLDDTSPLTDWWKAMTWDDIQKDAKVLYMTRKYIEMCIEHPKLYSFGHFQQLLCSICQQPWHLQTLGFFAPVDTAAIGQYFFSDRVLDTADYCDEVSSPSRMDGHLEHALLGWNTGDFLPGSAVEVFHASNVSDVVLSSLFHLLQKQAAIKKCANCGKFFVPLARSDAIYCDRPAPQDSARTCKAYGSKVLWYTNVVSDDVAKLARNIYCAKQMLVKRNPDKPEYAEMFEYFKTQKKVWEQQIKAGTKTREEFAGWLRRVKLCKTLGELEQS